MRVPPLFAKELYHFEPFIKYPLLLAAMGFYEAKDVIDQSHPAHPRWNGFQDGGTYSELVAEWGKDRKKLVFVVFEFDENGQKDLLVRFISLLPHTPRGIR